MTLASRTMRVMAQAIRVPVLVAFCLSLLAAAYLGFSLVHLGHDKAIHFTTFFILTVEFYWLWVQLRPWMITLLCMCLGASIGLEYLQNMVNPLRAFDYMDIAYNVAGSGLGLIFCMAVHAYKRRPRSALLERDGAGGFANVRMNDVAV